MSAIKRIKKSSSTSEKIHPPTAPPVQSTRRTNITGKQPSWDQMILLTPEESSSWTFISQRTTHSSQPRSTSQPGSIIQTSTRTARFAWISSKSSGPQLSPSPRFCSPSAPCWLIQTQMILWCQRSLRSTKLTSQSTRPQPESGLESMPCDQDVSKIFLSTFESYILSEPILAARHERQANIDSIQKIFPHHSLLQKCSKILS